MPEPITVGALTAEPGKRVFGYLPCGVLAGGTECRIGVQLLHGRHPGPTLCLISTLHGWEPMGAEAVDLEFDRSAPTRLQARGQEVRPTRLGADGSVTFPVPLGSGRVHSMWWTGGSHHLYTLKFRLPGAPLKPIAFQVIQRGP